MLSKRKREAAKPLSNELWEDHKEILRDLYLNCTLKELVSKMEAEHNFVASTYQYNTQFRKWGLRKHNLTAEEFEIAPYKKHKKQAIEPPPDENWEKYKEILQDLYSSATLEKLISTMKTKHNFIASKNQYERKFKAWGFRRNLNAQEWEYVFRKKRKRDELGKESQVFLNGTMIPAKRVKKQEQRYDSKELERIHYAAWDAPSPPGVTVATPSAVSQTLCEKLFIQVNNLPSIMLRTFFFEQGNQNPSSRVHINVTSNGLTAGFSSIIGSNEWGGEPSFSSHDISGTNLSLPPGSGHNNLIPTKVVFGNKESVRRSLESITLGLNETDLDRQVERLFAPNSSLEFLYLIANFTSNNMLNYDQKTWVLKWIGIQSDSLLRKMFASPLPSIQACFDEFIVMALMSRKRGCFMLLSRSIPQSWLTGRRLQQILLGALHLEIDDIAKELLKTGINVNAQLFASIWKKDKCKRPTILGAARSIEMVRVVLGLGADVDAPSYDIFTFDYYPPIYHAVKRGDTALAQVFLDSSASFDPNFVYSYDYRKGMPLLGHAIMHRRVSLIKWLLVQGAELSFNVGEYMFSLRQTEPQEAVNTDDIEILSMLLAQQPAQRFLDSGHDPPLCQAAAQGKVEMVRALIQAGADALEIAMAHGHSDIVSKLMNLCAGDPFNYWINELYECGRKRDIEKARSLIWSGIDAAHLVDALPINCSKEEAQLLGKNIIATFMEISGDLNITGPKYGKSALHIAIEVGNMDVALFLIHCGVPLNCVVPVHGSILQLFLHFWRCERDTASGDKKTLDEVCRLDVLKEMLSAGADPNIPVAPDTPVASTILELALWRGGGYASERARVLLDHKARVDGNEKVLSAAIKSFCNIDVIRRLLDDGAVIDPPSEFENPLQSAIQVLNIKKWPTGVAVVKLLLERSADVNTPTSKRFMFEPFTALQAAADGGYIDIVNMLLDKGATVEGWRGQTALQAAAWKGHFEMVRLLLDNGADVNAPAAEALSRTALQAAAWKGHFEMVRLLLDNGADVNAPAAVLGRTALQEAASEEHFEMVRLLLDNGADVNAPAAVLGRTALQAAASEEHFEMVRLLLDNGADVNAPAAVLGRTALQEAASEEHFEMVRLLLDNGADVNAPPAKGGGTTALQAAARAGNIKILHVLLESGAEVNAPPAEDEGFTALQGAAMEGHLKIAKILLERGADPNAPGTQIGGLKALECAADFGKLDMVQLLLNAGAIPSQPVLEIAEENSDFVIADLLREEMRKREQGDVNKGEQAGRDSGFQENHKSESDVGFAPAIDLNLNAPSRVFEVEEFEDIYSADF